MWILAAFLIVHTLSYTESFEDYPSINVSQPQESAGTYNYRSRMVQAKLPGNEKLLYRIDLTSIDWHGKMGGNNAMLWLESDESPDFGYYQIYPVGLNSTLNASEEQRHLSWKKLFTTMGDWPSKQLYYYKTLESIFICNVQKEVYWVQLSSEVSQETTVSFRVRVEERKQPTEVPCGSVLHKIYMEKVHNITDVVYESAKVHTPAIGGHDKVFYQVDLRYMDKNLLSHNSQLRFSFSDLPSHGDWAVRINDKWNFNGTVLKRKTWSEDSGSSDDAFICSPENQIYYFEIESENTNVSTSGSFSVYVKNHQIACGPNNSDADVSLSRFFIILYTVIITVTVVLCLLCCMTCACVFLGVDALTGFYGYFPKKGCCYSTHLLSSYEIMEDDKRRGDVLPEEGNDRRISVKLGQNSLTDSSAVQLSVERSLQE